MWASKRGRLENRRFNRALVEAGPLVLYSGKEEDAGRKARRYI
jgi:hypothetical protein